MVSNRAMKKSLTGLTAVYGHIILVSLILSEATNNPYPPEIRRTCLTRVNIGEKNGPENSSYSRTQQN